MFIEVTGATALGSVLSTAALYFPYKVATIYWRVIGF
jgi:hypothetical protein